MHVFISYAHKDEEFVRRLYADLRANGIDVWLDQFNIEPGENWRSVIQEALRQARLVLLVISEASIQSDFVWSERTYAVKKAKEFIPIVIGDVSPNYDPFEYITQQFIDFREDYQEALKLLVGALKSSWHSNSPEVPPKEDNVEIARDAPNPSNKGYVFISYTSDDADFVERLKDFFRQRGYAYWDYRESERDYHAELYRELEAKIEEAAAFVSILSDTWRDTPWTAREYIYAEETKVPIFVIEARPRKRTTPIILNLQPRIDLATDFDRGLVILGHELDKKGL